MPRIRAGTADRSRADRVGHAGLRSPWGCLGVANPSECQLSQFGRNGSCAKRALASVHWRPTEESVSPLSLHAELRSRDKPELRESASALGILRSLGPE